MSLTAEDKIQFLLVSELQKICGENHLNIFKPGFMIQLYFIFTFAKMIVVYVLVTS